MPASNLDDFTVSKTRSKSSRESSARSSAPFLHCSELLPLDHAYPMILVDGQDFDNLD